MIAPVVKRCACGASYTRETWAALPYGYRQTWPWGEIHEARVCTATIASGARAGQTCGSHIVITVTEGDE